MPELPEVHTIACGLETALQGREFTGVEVRRPASVDGDPSWLAKELPGKVITRIWRRGKALIMDVEPKLVLGFHLRMTGRLYLPEPGAEPGKHTHLIFRLAPKSGQSDRLFFEDPRTFGSCRPMRQGELADWPFFAALGPEPLDISAQEFAGLFKGRSAKVKGLLLDQTFIAGIGNIYADESLFRAKIRPDAGADSLSAEKLRGLHKVLVEVLNEAIAACGSSISDYRDAQGNAGAFQNEFRVYGRAGEACMACGSKLSAMKVAGRTTVYCSRCQPKRRK